MKNRYTLSQFIIAKIHELSICKMRAPCTGYDALQADVNIHMWEHGIGNLVL